MLNIGFSGVPGTGKTSTARQLAAQCRRVESLKKVELVSEYARRYLSEYGPIENVQEQFRILQKQIQWEKSASKGADILITDCPIFLGFLYCLQLRKVGNKKDTLWINDVFKQMSKYNVEPRYDIIFHIPPKLDPVRDGIREDYQFDQEWRNKANLQLKFIFDIFPPKNFVIVEEIDLNDRVDFCIKKIKEVINKNENTI